MADKGFTIHDELKDLGLSLIIPSFAVADKRMSQANLVLTDKIASHSCRTTDLSDKRFQDPESQDCCSPFSPSGKLNQVWCVCCYLTLCQGYVLKKTRYVCVQFLHNKYASLSWSFYQDFSTEDTERIT